MINMYPRYNNVKRQLNKTLLNYHVELPLKSLSGALINSNLHNRIYYKSYNEMQKLGKTVPIKYLNSSKRNNNAIVLAESKIEDNDVLGWCKCPSLLNINENIFVPIYMLLNDYNINTRQGKIRCLPTPSIGVSLHSSYFKALERAIVESIQLDPLKFSRNTTVKYKQVIIDDESVLNILRKEKLLGVECPFDIIPLYITRDDVNLPNFVIALRRKDQSHYRLITLHADLDPVYGLLKGIMKALEIAKSSCFNRASYPKTKDETFDKYQNTELNDNAFYYTRYNHELNKIGITEELIDGAIKLSDIENVHQQSTEANIMFLLNELRNVSEYAAFIDITTSKLSNKGCHALKVVVPEML